MVTVSIPQKGSHGQKIFKKLMHLKIPSDGFPWGNRGSTEMFQLWYWFLGPVWGLGSRFHPTEIFWQDGRLKRPHTWMDYHPTPGQDFAIWYIWHTKYQIPNTKYTWMDYHSTPGQERSLRFPWFHTWTKDYHLTPCQDLTHGLPHEPHELPLESGFPTAT